jgi:hypothetical protein
LSYGGSLPEAFRQQGIYVARILRTNSEHSDRDLPISATPRARP